MASPAAGPSAIATATARFSSTMGEPVRIASCSYSPAMRCQSVASGVPARAWQAAISACSTYVPAPPIAAAWASARSAWLISTRSQRVRSWSSSVTGEPSAATRARSRDAWISISATSPNASASPGASPHTMRPNRIASAHSSGRAHDVPEVAV
jgi:hypothetical protein